MAGMFSSSLFVSCPFHFSILVAVLLGTEILAKPFDRSFFFVDVYSAHRAVFLEKSKHLLFIQTHRISI